jgi:hypothetical protein
MAMNETLVRGENFLNYAKHVLSYYDKPRDDPRSIKDGDVVYCDTRSLYTYREHLLKRKDLVIITHNCIGHVKDTPPERAEDVNTSDFEDCFRLWFAKNSFSTRDNVHPIPLGFENKRWDKRGLKARFINNIVHREPTKDLYLNCKIGTNKNVRQDCWNKCKSMGIDVEGPNRTFESYMNKMMDYRFIVSPDGAGVDCHRTYESFLLRRVPIIRNTYPLNNLYGDMPVVYVDDDWYNIRNLDLHKIYNEMKDQFNPEFLTQNYWKIKIRRLIDV